jgi:hypothetical protein
MILSALMKSRDFNGISFLKNSKIASLRSFFAGSQMFSSGLAAKSIFVGAISPEKRLTFFLSKHSSFVARIASEYASN